MKKIVSISLIILAIAVVGFIGVNLLNKPQPQVNTQNQQENVNQNQQTETKKITLAEISTHNTASDCWQIINGKVYNATEILKIHKNATQLVLPLCGKDVTTAFTTRNGFGPHPEKAFEKVSSYYLGDFQQ